MPIDTLHVESALVLLDLQLGITALPTVHAADGVVAQAARLARAFRDHGLPVVRVRVAWSDDGGDVVRSRVDEQPPPMTTGPDFATYRPEIGHAPHDIEIVKRGWDAFQNTELDLQLRRRGVRSIVLAGIRTCISVESTARTGFGLNYEQIIAADAISDTSVEAHENSVQRILPRLARLDSTGAIIAALS